MQLDRNLLSKIVLSIDSVIHNLGEIANPIRIEQVIGRKRKIGTICRGTKQNKSICGDFRKKESLENSTPGLEQQFLELYNLLRCGVLGINDVSGKVDIKKRNVSALLMGPRGHGKSFVLDKCLATLRREAEESSACSSNTKEEKERCINRASARLCRIVRLNGTLLRGHDVVSAVKEIVRQLSEIAAEEAIQRLRNSQKSCHKEKLVSLKKDRVAEDEDIRNNAATDSLFKLLQKDSHSLRLRQTSFNSSLALLDEVIQTALVDSIPILIVLEELDTFLAYSSMPRSVGAENRNISSINLTAPPTERHLLLYHLLDRVAGHGSLLSLVGMTSRLSTVSLFEKRVKSRAEGTSKVIYFGHTASFEILVEVIMSKFKIAEMYRKVGSHTDGETERIDIDFIEKLKSQLRLILLPSKLDEYSVSEQERKVKVQALEVYYMFNRSYSLGFDNRWFMRVISMALSLFVEDLYRFYFTSTKFVKPKRNGHKSDSTGKYVPKIINFEPKYLLEALMVMGGTKLPRVNFLGGKYSDVSQKFDETSLSLDTNLMSHENGSFYYGPFNGGGQQTSIIGWDSARLRTLTDLSRPQVVILLAAKRILLRDAQKDLNSCSPLTYERIRNEYESYNASGLDCYEGHILYQSYCQLMETDLIRPVRDHTGGGLFQYFYEGHNRPVELDSMTLKRLPLYINVDIYEELEQALKRNMLDCSTALRDWGLKVN